MPETSQQEADRLLAEDRARRATPAHMEAGWTPAGRAWLAAGAPIGRAYPQFVGRVLRPLAALGQPFGRVPYSTADQTRNALLAAFAGEPETIRRSLRHALANASDAAMIRARSLIRDR